MRRRPGVGIGIAVTAAVALVLLIADNNDQNRAASNAELAPGGTVNARVLGVVDGDTIDVLIGGGEERVRYIGVDTPETEKPGERGDCYAQEATQRNEAIVAQGEVTLEFDRELRDRYGRLLAYVSVGGRKVSEELIRGGFAQTLRIEPNTTRAERLARLEAEAGNAGRGLWGAC